MTDVNELSEGQLPPAPAGVGAQLRERGVEIRSLVQRVQFGLVGEHEIDGALAHQVEKLVAVAIDAEGIR